MKPTTHNRITTVGSLLLAVLLNGCFAEHNNNDGHSHGPGGKQATAHEDHAHSDEMENETFLTDEQIKTVGIVLGQLEQKNLTANLKANGVLRVPNKNKANVTSLFGGVVKTLSIELGDAIRKGEIVATIENPQFIQQQEEFLTIQSRVAVAEQELNRQQELNDSNAGTGRNLQNATAELRTLKIRLASLQQQLGLMGLDPSQITDQHLRNSLSVKSPIDGTVGNVFAKVGSYVDVATPLAEIVDNGLLHLDLQIFERDLPKVRIGQPIEFTITNNPDKVYKAKVFNIGSSFQSESKTIAVHSAIEGDKKGLIDGMNISAHLSIANVTMPSVPAEAIVEADGKYFVFVQKSSQTEPYKHAGHKQDHDHHHPKETVNHSTKPSGNMFFERIEVAKGVSNAGYTTITPVKDIPLNSRVVVKGAFFVNATLSSSAEHAHAH